MVEADSATEKADKSVVKRLSPASVKILKEYDPSFMVSNQSPDAAIATMKLLIAPGAVVTAPQPDSAGCKYDETRLLKRMSGVVQEACDNALRPYVS